MVQWHLLYVFSKYLFEAKQIASEIFVNHGNSEWISYPKSVMILYNVIGASEERLNKRFVVLDFKLLNRSHLDIFKTTIRRLLASTR